jgi:DNA helicase-2/ATP-dependent DNA helicase PcrA
MKSRGYGLIALVCRNERECAKLHGALEHMENVYNASPDMEAFSKGVTLFPAPLVKGLEFDAVVVWDADPSRYGDTPSDARLLYVVLTRALHELHVCAVGELTELLTSE